MQSRRKASLRFKALSGGGEGGIENKINDHAEESGKLKYRDRECT